MNLLYQNDRRLKQSARMVRLEWEWPYDVTSGSEAATWSAILARG